MGKYIEELKKQQSLSAFVSSTFRDLIDEREILMKRVFPQIRKLCAERGVIWNEIDLRWGITDEEKSEGKVLPICLRRIDDCRPVFIGLVGDRYGWIPEESEFSDELLKKEPWLKEHIGSSVTEIEFIHGALKQPNNDGYAFFYLRKSLENIENDNQESHKLKKLKNELYKRESDHFLVKEYLTHEEFESMAINDLTKMIDELFPPFGNVHPAEQEDLVHETYMRNLSRVYVERAGYFKKIDDYVSSMQTIPQIVRGNSGIGKSALLANWVMKRQEQFPEDIVIGHFVGASKTSTDALQMVKTILQRLSLRIGIDLTLPNNMSTAKEIFHLGLRKSSKYVNGSIILVLDGLNQLEDRDGAHELIWLPKELPINVKIIISSLDGKIINSIEKKNWKKQELNVEGLNQGECKEVITGYLELFGKKLQSDLIELIILSPNTSNPLYLRFLLEELRLYGNYDDLKEKLFYYLQFKEPEELIEAIFDRCEDEFEGNYKGLVGTALSLIYCSKTGIAENELLEMLAFDGEPLPSAIWSPLYLALESFLIIKSGLIDLSHDFVRKAVIKKYLFSNEKKTEIHNKIIEYWENVEITNKRAYEEYPWHLAQVGLWNDLSEFLTDESFLPTLWMKNPHNVLEYWTLIENDSTIRRDFVYLGQDLSSTEYPVTYLHACYQILNYTGDKENIKQIYHNITSRLWSEIRNFTPFSSVEVLTIKEELKFNLFELSFFMACFRLLEQIDLLEVCDEEVIQYYRYIVNDYNNHGMDFQIENYVSIATLLLQAYKHTSDNNISLAKDSYNSLEEKVNELNDDILELFILIGRAELYYTANDYNVSLRFYKSAEKILNSINSYELQFLYRQRYRTIYLMILDNQTQEEAYRFLKETEMVARGNQDLVLLAEILLYKGLLYERLRKENDALNSYLEALEISRNLGLVEVRVKALIKIGEIYRQKNNSEEVLKYNLEANPFINMLREPDVSLELLISRTMLYQELEEEQQSLEVFKSACQLAEILGLFNEIQTVLNKELHKYSWKLNKKQTYATITKLKLLPDDIENRSETTFLRFLGFDFLHQKHFKEAFLIFQDVEKLAIKNNEQEELIYALRHQAEACVGLSEYDKAIDLYKKVEKNERSSNNQYFLTKDINCQGDLLVLKGEYQQALSKYQEAEEIVRKTQQQFTDLINSLSGQIDVYKTWGERTLSENILVEIFKLGHQIGQHYEENGAPDEAILLYIEIAKAMRKHENDHYLLDYLDKIRKLAEFFVDTNLILSTTKEAEEVCKRLGDEEGEKLYKFLHAEFYFDHGKINGADGIYLNDKLNLIEYYEQVGVYFSLTENKPFLAICYKRLAILYSNLDEIGKALFSIRQAEKMYFILEDYDRLNECITLHITFLKRLENLEEMYV